jgi:hypothetical protein
MHRPSGKNEGLISVGRLSIIKKRTTDHSTRYQTLLGPLVFSCIILSSVSSFHYLNQFEDGSEQLRLPQIVFFSIYMGRVAYKHMPLLLESMRWNQNVNFILINIVQSSHHASKLIRLKQHLNVQNFYVRVVSFEEFSNIVEKKLGIRIQFDESWYYKMCDFKPTLPYLFPELSDPQIYKYWGFGDMDLIWGNISRFSHWFQGSYPLVHTYWNKPHGSAQFHVNEPWTRELFLIDPMYVQLLRNKTYHNLDEIGTQTKAENIVNSGFHAIGYAHVKASRRRKFDLRGNRGKHEYDNAYIEQEDSVRWAGHVRWFRGVRADVLKYVVFYVTLLA